jgi:catechol 2,3-dioxygenase-like lactoylglutathione lyase family enzyme
MRIGSIVIDCDDFPRMLAFWQEALHYVPKYPPDEGWVILKDPQGRGPNLSLNLSAEGHLNQYRLHLDLYAEDQKAEVQRLLRLGATLHRSTQPGEDFVVLADPDGNLFCVVQV